MTKFFNWLFMPMYEKPTKWTLIGDGAGHRR